MNRRAVRLAWVLIWTVALWGFSALAILPPINSGQGTQLHGTSAYEHVNIPLAGKPPCTFNRPDAGYAPELQCRTASGEAMSGPRLQGWTFKATHDGATVQLRIGSVTRHENILGPLGDAGTVHPARPLWEYKVMVQTRDGEQNLCAPPAISALAVPFAWSASGELLAEPGFFTFACVPRKDLNAAVRGGGAIAKCIDWGYPPWSDPRASLVRPPEATIDARLTSYDDQVAMRFHQTCVRMATADYCGEGFSNTVTDTPIGIADVSNVLSPPSSGTPALAQRSGSSGITLVPEPAPSQFPLPSGNTAPLRLEGIWGVDSCGRARILCLSRARWNTLSLAATCTDRVMARRLSTPDKSPKLCEEWTLADLSRGEATLFSYSTTWDRAVVTFADQRGRLVTTSQVQHLFPPAMGRTTYGDDRDGFTFQESTWPGSPVQNASFREVRYEGRVFSDKMPAPLQGNLCIQSGLAPGCLRTLVQYRNAAGDYLATTTQPPDPGYAPLSPGPEGLVYASQPPKAEAAPLYLWKCPERRFATSTASQLDGCERMPQGPVGWLPLRSALAY